MNDISNDISDDMTSDMLRTVDRVCDTLCSRELRESAEAGVWPAGLWQALAETGLDRVALPEAAGGPGLAFADAMAALKRSAWHAAPAPLAETMLAGRLLCAAGIAVPEGALTVAPDSSAATLAIDGDGLLTGAAQRVPWGAQCKAVVVVAGRDDVEMLCLVAIDGAVRKSEKNLGGDPRALLQFERSPVVAAAPLPGAADWLWAEGALYRSVQMAGALERILAYSLQYAGERVQFGRPIGKFQAVQHMLALLAGHAAAAGAAADAAIDAGAIRPSEFAVAVAKARIGEAAGKGAEIAHQIHAAMGYTREHNLHFVSRRLWAWRDEFGNETHWQMRLGRLVARQGADALWPMLTAL